MRSQTWESARFEKMACFKGGGGGGAPATTTTVQKADPWSGQQPYLTDIFTQAQTLSGTPQEFYPGQTFADQSPETQLAMGAQANRAVMGSPLTGAAQNELTQTLSGSYLDAGNPYFSNAMNAAANQIRPRIDSQFAAGGRYGSGLHSGTMAQALSDTAGQLAYQNYGDERMNQMRGMLFAPQMAQQDYFDIAKLAEVGASQEDYTQQSINDAMQRWNYEQNEPWQRLGQYSNLTQGFYGGTTNTDSSVQMPPRSIGAGLLGGAAAGGGLGYMLGGPQYGMYGAGLGALSQLF